MNRNQTGNMPKNFTPNRSNTSTLNKTKNNILPTTTSTSSSKTLYKTASNLQSSKYKVGPGTEHNTGGPSTPTSNHASRIAIKTPLPLSATTTSSTDNTHTTDTIASRAINNTFTNDQPIMDRSTISPLNTTNIINFATAVATEKIPSREQALVFNSIDGIPQKEYILAIGKIVSPKNITFISRISNNRFCIFLSSKQILDNLIQTTQTININEHTIQIRRLLNPAKRFIISNVCPSIPNQAITDALKNLDIHPISQINHLKAGINIAGYEHIMSFRRQVFLKHEDIHKLPNSLVISLNETQFRIFFTDDVLTCFLCKTTGHTTNNCKLNIEDKSEKNPLSNTNDLNKSDVTTEDVTELIENIPPPSNPSLDNIQLDQTENDLNEVLEETEVFPSTQSHIADPCSASCTPKETHKRLKSDSSSSKPPNSPNFLLSSSTTNKEKKTKKPKLQSRSNSSESIDTKLDEGLKPIIEFFTANDPLPVTYLQFKYILNNFNNKAMNIHTLIENANTNIPTLMDLLDKIRHITKERSMKTRLTKLSNLLFQTQPLQ